GLVGVGAVAVRGGDVGDRAGVEVGLADRVRRGAAGRGAGRQRAAAAGRDRALFVVGDRERAGQGGVTAVGDQVRVGDQLARSGEGRGGGGLGGRKGGW